MDILQRAAALASRREEAVVSVAQRWFIQPGPSHESEDFLPLPPGSGEPPCPVQAGDPPERREDEGPPQLH